MSWDMVELGEIFEIARGGSPRPIQNYITNDPSGVNWIMIGDVTNSDKYITSTKKRIKKSGIRKSRKVFPGDFLLTNSMSFGRPYILKTEGCIHDGWLVLSPKNNNTNHDFFYHLLGSETVKTIFKKKASGAVVKNLNIDLVKSVKIPLPTLSEQKRIAAILDKADAIRRKRKQALELADEFLRATFLDMFGDPVTNPKGWEVKELGEIASVNRGKFTPRPRNDPQYYGGDIPFIQTGDIVNSDTYVTKHAQTLNKKGLKVSRIFPTGTIAITIAANIGETAILSYPMCFPDSVVGIEAHEEESIFLEYALRSHKRMLHLRATETAQKNINLQNLKPLKIIRPEKRLVTKFTNIVSSVIKSKTRQNTNDADTLFASLSQKAFRGEL